MSTEWPRIPLGELTENFDGKRVPVKEADRKSGPYPYYGASGIVDWVDGYLFDGEYLLIGEDGENLRTRQTPVAFMASGKFWVNNHAHIIRGSQRADSRFLCYALSQTDISGYLTGSTMPKLTQGNLNRLPVIAPPLPIQKAIARILGTLDDKIELNRRMNTTLEAMACALFQSWFVDFDPVHAKAAGREPSGMDAATAALFPSTFQNSELGKIPAGWSAPKLSEIFTESNERIGKIPAPEYSSTNDGLQPRSERYTKSLSASSEKNKLIKKGYFVFGLSRRVLNFGLMKEAIGSVSSAYKVYSVDEQRCSSDLIERYMRLNPAYFFKAVSASSREGQSVSNDSLGSLHFIEAPQAIQKAFYELCGPLLQRIRVNENESQTLATLRDTLLPKLLSGELNMAAVEEESSA